MCPESRWHWSRRWLHWLLLWFRCTVFLKFVLNRFYFILENGIISIELLSLLLILVLLLNGVMQKNVQVFYSLAHCAIVLDVLFGWNALPHVCFKMTAALTNVVLLRRGACDRRR